MAGMSTVLTLQARSGHSSTYTVPAVHTALKPKLVLQKRKVPSGNQSMMEDTITVLDSTVDSADVLLDSKIAVTVIVRRPKQGASADVTAALARFRDIVAGDEFGAVVTAQSNLA
jgi:hypothetical protein